MKYAVTRGWQLASRSAVASCAACSAGASVRDDVLLTGVVRAAPVRDGRLEAVLEIPDRRGGLCRAHERLVEDRNEPVVVPLADVDVVPGGRRLAGKERVRVVADTVEERQRRPLAR